jgi:negative regulator of flagellin synthesis FlgM
MRISDTELKKVIEAGQTTRPNDVEVDERIRREDAALIQRLTERVKSMADREELIADLKARIEAGAYQPTGDEIAEAMVRRSIADRVK